MDRNTQKIIETVQHNCHIADARHAGDYTLCVYLLKMREMYRWEKGIDFNTLLTTDDVGDWLSEREGLWDELEEQEYKPLSINSQHYEPFDNKLINTMLEEENLVYNAGLGVRCRPHFFVADLQERIQHDEYTVYISGKEHARDMAAPAAMAQGNSIFIRRESLRRVIWEILDDARVNGNVDPVGFVDPSGNFSLGSIGASLNTIGTLANIASTTYSVFQIATGEEGFTARSIGTLLLASISPRIAKRAFKKFFPCNSFTGETLISTEFGLREIKEVQIGEYVWAYDEKTGNKSLQEVVHLIQGEGIKELVDIQLASGYVITATANHPFYNSKTGEWIAQSTFQFMMSYLTKEIMM